jgi:hypothetical protein
MPYSLNKRAPTLNQILHPYQPPNGLRYLRVGGRGFCLGAGKTQSQKNA